MNSDLIAMLEYLEREKSIKREVLVEAISDALLAASKKSFTAGTRELAKPTNHPAACQTLIPQICPLLELSPPQKLGACSLTALAQAFILPDSGA